MGNDSFVSSTCDRQNGRGRGRWGGRGTVRDPRYSPELKARARALKAAGKMNVREIARELDVPYNTVYGWLRA